MTGKKAEKESGARRAMLAFWAVASVLWVLFSGYMFHLDRAAEAYRNYHHYEQMIADGISSDYTRRAYMKATDTLNGVSRDIGLFFLVGIGMPGLLLSAGTWLLRKKK